ncbi:MAG TPA: EF2563 family selenium-dependent molybdenum hydroxylase system protein [Candidatus Pullilachnospira intestinigallinarum]|nr:EF2563 family selenium-dependent molybdenum hydroxylase system protein [Candidatus Pullilachnospira intestinigallinarum]
MNQTTVIVRGGGDLATGTIYRLFRCGYPVLVLETADPSAIRREAAFCEAVHLGEKTVEGLVCERIRDAKDCSGVWKRGRIPLLVDEEARAVETLKPQVVVDAILAKKNLGTRRDMAPLTVGLGPGFAAGRDVDCVIETMRGHRLGRIILEGEALPNTGVPGIIGGYGKERVIHAPASGIIRNEASIGDWVEQGREIARIGQTPVTASITGVLRGIIRDGYPVKKGLKIADIDPRKGERENCFTISDKARCIAGGVLEAIVSWENGTWRPQK